MPIASTALARAVAALLCIAPAWSATGDVDDLLELLGRGLQPRASAVAEALAEGGPREVSRWLREAPASSRISSMMLEALNRAILQELGLRQAADGLEESARLDVAHAGLMLAEAVGEENDLELVLALGRVPEGADSVLWRGVRRELEAALQSVLTRHPSGVRAAAGLYADQGWPEALSLARAIAGVESQAALESLPGLLGVHPQNDGSVLGEIGSAAERTRTPLSGTGLHRVRAYLVSPEAHDRRQAAYALGRLDDYDSVEVLLDLLTDEDGGVRRVSHWALQRITRMTIAQDAPRWKAWFAEESGWWATRGQDAIAVLRTAGTAAELVPVINECATKRLFRPFLAPELEPLLDHPNPAVVRMCCSALLSLRAREAAPAIVDLLDAPEPEVSSLAWKVLRELTGHELPPDSGAWRDALAASEAVPR